MSGRAAWQAALGQFVREMQSLFGARLEGVFLFGSRARDDASGDSDIDTLVVLDQVKDFWREFERLSPAAARVSLEHDVVISAIPVGRKAFRDGASPFLRNARREGRRIA